MRKQLITLFAGITVTLNFLPCHAQDTVQTAKATIEARLPLRNLRPTSGFGWRVHPITGQFQFHKGIDLAARHDNVYSVLNGTVSNIGYNAYIGNYIIITHPGELQSIYGHLSVIAVLPDEHVMAGQLIGITGATGRVTGEHLHFSIKYQGRELSPLAFLGGLFARPP